MLATPRAASDHSWGAAAPNGAAVVRCVAMAGMARAIMTIPCMVASIRVPTASSVTPEQRILRALEAGVDQFGGEYCPELVVDLVRGGAVTQDRLDASAARILREKFALGLFDQRRVDVDRGTRTGRPTPRRCDWSGDVDEVDDRLG